MRITHTNIGRCNVNPRFIGGYVTRYIVGEWGDYKRTTYFRIYKNMI